MNHALLHLLFGVMWACLQSSCMNAGGLRHQLCDSERCPVLQQCSCDRPPLAQTRERMYLCKCRYPRMEWIASSLTGGNSDYRDCFRRLTEKCFVVWRRTSACSESVFCFHVICSIHKAKVLRTNHLFNVSSSCKPRIQWAPVLWGCCRCKPHCQWYLRAGRAAVQAGHEQRQPSSAWRCLSRPVASCLVPLVTTPVITAGTKGFYAQVFDVASASEKQVIGFRTSWALERCFSSGNPGPDRAGRLHGLPW